MEKLQSFVVRMYRKYKEFILYGIFGALTTVVNYVLYFGFNAVFTFDKGYLISQGIAWVGAVVFAFITCSRRTQPTVWDVRLYLFFPVALLPVLWRRF